MYGSRSKEEIDASNKYHTYVRGWRDGAGVRPMRLDHSAHPTLGATYDEAYAAGQQATRNMSAAAAARFGYTPSILRLADTGTETSGTSAETKEQEG